MMGRPNRSLYVRAVIHDFRGTALMRQIKIPTILVEVPKSVVDLKGYVVAGQCFWREQKWNVSRCLMCFKESTKLELMICDAGKNIACTTEEIYLAPSHVVRCIRSEISPSDLKIQLEKDKENLPLPANSKPLLSTFMAEMKEDDLKSKLETLESRILQQEQENTLLVSRIKQLESALANPGQKHKRHVDDTDDRMDTSQPGKRRRLNAADAAASAPAVHTAAQTLRPTGVAL
ncbi:hypothetical protein AAMO2058_000555500 [Amorphochlora amoebiformis]